MSHVGGNDVEKNDIQPARSISDMPYFLNTVRQYLR